MELTYAGYCWDERGRGWRQRDMTVRVDYDREYVRSRYAAIDDQVWLLSARRLDVLEAFVPRRGRLLDFGCGTGRGILQAGNRGWDAVGCDLVDGPGRRCSLVEATDQTWDVLTCFDSLEHLPDPDELVRAINPAVVMVSVPWCHHPERPDWFMGWRHRRPGEHLWHWRRDSLDRLFAELGYRLVMHSAIEDEFRVNPHQAEPNILTAIYRRREPRPV